MKICLNKCIKDMNAITLIALVITIVVLIILATVVINLSLGDNGIFNRARTAKEQYQNAEDQEQMDIAKAINEIDIQSNRSNVTISQDEYNRLMRKGYTLLWEGLANKQGSSDNSGNNYTFRQADMDIDNYDFILIEYIQTNGSQESAMDSDMFNSSSISKNKNSNIRLNGYNTRYTDMHFVNNGFYIDTIDQGDAAYYLYVTKIYGINI